MTRLLTMDEIGEHFRMEDCLDSMEVMFEEMGHGRAITDMRQDIYTYQDSPPAGTTDPVYYDLKSMGGVIPAMGVGAIRINSYLRHHPVRGGVRRWQKFPAADGRIVGLILLFSTDTCEPLMMFPDRIVQSYRVGATNALGSKYLARDDASHLGLYGAGWQARAHLLAHDVVHDLEEVTVYSPTPDNRRDFVEEMADHVAPDIVAASEPREVAAGADIVQCTTNSLSPVFDFDWIEPGTHVALVHDAEAPDEFFDIDNYEAFIQAWSEITEYVEAGDQVSERHVTSREVYDYVVPGPEMIPIIADKQENGEPLCDWSEIPGLGEVMVEGGVGRTTEDGLTGFYNRGMGIQFAAAGKVLLDVAEREDLGVEIDTELLTEEPLPDIPIQ